MELRPALLGMLILILAVPSASALPAVDLPRVVDTCATSPLATCLDSVAPGVKLSRALPGILVPDPAPEPAPPAGEPAQTSSTEPDATPFGPTGQGSASTSSIASGIPQAYLLTALVAVAAFALVLFVLLVAARARRQPKAARLVDAARAQAMQDAIDAAWRDARKSQAQSTKP